MDYNHRSPGVEDAVSDDSSDRRTADHVVPIDVAAEDAVVEVVGHAVIVNRADVVRNAHVVTEVVVIRVHVGSGLRSGSSTRSTCVSVVLRNRLRTGLSMLGIASLGIVIGRGCSRRRRSAIATRAHRT